MTSRTLLIALLALMLAGEAVLAQNGVAWGKKGGNPIANARKQANKKHWTWEGGADYPENEEQYPVCISPNPPSDNIGTTRHRGWCAPPGSALMYTPQHSCRAAVTRSIITPMAGCRSLQGSTWDSGVCRAGLSIGPTRCCPRVVAQPRAATSPRPALSRSASA